MAFERPKSEIELAQEKLMSVEAYAETSHETPYVFEVEKGGKRLMYFGAPHTFDPQDPVLTDIEARYGAADPDIVVAEITSGVDGRQEKYRQWAASHSREEVVRGGGESVFAAWLAIRDGKELKSGEPSLQDESRYLETQRFSREEMFVFFVVRSLNQYQRMEDPQESFEQYVQPQLDHLSKNLRWRDFPFTITQFVALYEKITGRPFDIVLEPLGEMCDPISWPGGPERTRINEAATTSLKFRDLRIVQEIGEALRSHRKVFVVYGASHAVMQEPSMMALMGKEQH